MQYIATIMIFALLYTTVPTSCKAVINSYFDGFSFSVSVLFTIGFGTNGGDVFFNECAWMQIIITLEVGTEPLPHSLAFVVSLPF